jgi:hypothetical protein
MFGMGQTYADNLPNVALLLLFGGGIAYSCGAFVHARGSLPFHNASMAPIGPAWRELGTQDEVRDLEIGQPINSEECSETADGVARESEGRSWLSILRPVRRNADFPTINVNIKFPGASPETMATNVEQPLERQFSQIAGVAPMTSISVFGSSQITLQSTAAVRG